MTSLEQDTFPICDLLWDQVAFVIGILIMKVKTVWTLGSNDPENTTHFAEISQWWTNLKEQKITWRQRLLDQTQDVSDLNWDSQRFDEVFTVMHPEVRGITLYWQKPDSPQERNITAEKLELDSLRQQLYIFPQSQKKLVIRVELPEVTYQTIKLEEPLWHYSDSGESTVLRIRDEKQQLEVQVNLSPESLNQLKQQLP